MKIALVHDYLVQNGGAEQVLSCFCELFPEAPIYTLLYDKKAMRGRFSERTIIPSFLQKWPLAVSKHRLFPPFMPLAVEQFDFSQYDVVLSDSSSYAKGIITGPDTVHICYMHTPMRYAWDDCQRYAREFPFPRFIKKSIPFIMSPIRIWDRVSANRPDILVANSTFVAERIKKYYRRDAEIIHPPVSVENFFIADSVGDYFLMVGRLLAYKRFDVGIRAFNKLGLPLKIIGRGPELHRLKKIAGPTIEFLERVSDKELPEYYARCRAFVFPQEEDFGIVAIEALASGRPVLAYRGGDIPRHVREGETGIFFDAQTPEAVMRAVCTFQKTTFDPQKIRAASLPFDKNVFQRKIQERVQACVKSTKEIV